MLLLVADEEVGDAGVGAPFLVEALPDLRPDYVVGEGAGERFETASGPIYMVDHGVKATAGATLMVRGRPGDASLPDMGPNALHATGKLLQRLATHRSPVRITPEVEPLIDALRTGGDSAQARLAHARDEAEPAVDWILAALTGTTIHPSTLTADGPKNVVPERAELMISATTLPGTSTEDLEAELRGALGAGDYELQIVPPKGGSTSPLDTPLQHAIETFLAEHDPEARLVPALGYGLSDCHVMREAYESIAYGFIPFRHADPMHNLRSKHGVDERVLIDDLLFQTQTALSIARHVTGTAA